MKALTFSYLIFFNESAYTELLNLFNESAYNCLLTFLNESAYNVGSAFRDLFRSFCYFKGYFLVYF